jgi:hypothetical protein
VTSSAVLALDESNVNPGLLGFVVVACLAVATYLLIKSMNKQMRKIDFEEEPDPRATPTDDRDEPKPGS